MKYTSSGSGGTFSTGPISSSLPDFNIGDVIEIYYLESTYPPNVPADLEDYLFGPIFRDYVTTHAAIGIWNEQEDVKISVEFYSRDYVGSLLPTLFENGTMQWNNSVTIAVTVPMNEAFWKNSRLVICVKPESP